MERILAALFDYQRFVGDARLQALIADTERRCAPAVSALSDDMLDLYAAGEPVPVLRGKGDPPDV